MEYSAQNLHNINSVARTIWGKYGYHDVKLRGNMVFHLLPCGCPIEIPFYGCQNDLHNMKSKVP